ncbi:MAG: hypothetical protein Q7T97_10680, partial [Burkholderiaceae bacterium]|nr:hypothetical protein [Burkholderiaceae bacterium]
MTVTLNTAELQTLQAKETQAKSGQICYWEIYKWIADLLTTQYGVSATDSTVLWLRGATEANAGRGSMSALIRAYTESQYQLRYGTVPSAVQMQSASNAVAQNLLDDLLGRTAAQWHIGDVPDITRIAFADATAVGLELFGSKLGHSETDTAFTQNSAWSGTLLFSLLRSDQTARLTSTGTANEFDTLNDLRDVLYAFSAYAKGMVSARTNFLANVLAAAGGDVAASKQVGTDTQILGPTFAEYCNSLGSNSNLLSVLRLGAGSGAAGAAFQLIADSGLNRFLDMVMGAVQGKSLIGTTTDANFSANARTFFSLTPAELQSLQVKLLPTDAPGLASLAKTDVNVRAALAALSVVSVQVSNAVAQQFSLVDPVTGVGEITNQWIDDRAFLLDALATLNRSGAPDSVTLPTDRNLDFHWGDAAHPDHSLLASGHVYQPLDDFTTLPTQRIAFGRDDDDNLTGTSNYAGDHL